MTTPARSAVVLQAGMTHRACKRMVGVVWPDIELHLYRPTTAYHKEGRPTDDSETRDDDALAVVPPSRPGKPPPTDAVLVTGSASSRAIHDALYASFGLEAVFTNRFIGLPIPDVPTDTLDERQAFSERVRALFLAKHGRPPEPYDDFGGLGLVVYGRGPRA